MRRVPAAGCGPCPETTGHPEDGCLGTEEVAMASAALLCHHRRPRGGGGGTGA